MPILNPSELNDCNNTAESEIPSSPSKVGSCDHHRLFADCLKGTKDMVCFLVVAPTNYFSCMHLEEEQCFLHALIVVVQRNCPIHCRKQTKLRIVVHFPFPSAHVSGATPEVATFVRPCFCQSHDIPPNICFCTSRHINLVNGDSGAMKLLDWWYTNALSNNRCRRALLVHTQVFPTSGVVTPNMEKECLAKLVSIFSLDSTAQLLYFHIRPKQMIDEQQYSLCRPRRRLSLGEYNPHRTTAMVFDAPGFLVSPGLLPTSNDGKRM